MKRIVNHWYDLNLIVAIIIIIEIIINKTILNFPQRLILFEFAFYNLHLFEAFGHPGDMAGTLNVAMYHNDKSPTSYPFNQLSVIICGYLFGIIIWGIPLVIPQWHWLTLSAVLWGIIEFGLHLFYYPHRTRSSLSSGILTAMLGFLPCGLIYLAYIWQQDQFSIIGALIALIYPIAWDWIIFRILGAKFLSNRHPKFPFTTKQLVRYVKIIKEHPLHHHEPNEF